MAGEAGSTEKVRIVIDVVKGSQRVRYLLADEAQPACIPCRAGNVTKEIGAASQSETFLNIPGRQGASSALDYSLTLEYLSNRNTNGLVGSEWNHENFERLELQIDGSILHNNGLDRKDRYCLNETGNGFTAPPQFFTSLEQNPDGSYTLREADGTNKDFDANGNLVQISDRNGNFVTLQYDAQGRMSKFIDTMGRAIDYQYISSEVNAGRLDKVTDFSGRVVDLNYDNKGDLVEITSPAVTGTPDGNDFPQGKTTRYTYSSGFADESLNHNLLTVTRPNEVATGGPPSLVYQYGTSGFAFDKVISMTEGGTNASQGQEWNLDDVGNWDQTIITDENGVDTTDNRDHSSFNELITQNGVTLRYDDNGNLVEDAEYLYQWDSRNRLRVATRKGDGVVAEYSYDAMGRRIIKEVSNSGALDGVTYFYHDGMREIEERDGSNVLKQQYVYGNYIDEVLVMDQNLDGNNSAIDVGDKGFYYHQDALFSVYAVTGETGQVAESYLYDPYGQVTVFDGSGDPVPENAWGTAHSAINNPYLFTGRRLDEETGLYYYRARYLDSDQGRFISRDFQYQDVLNLYTYVWNNPTNAIDPLGLLTIKLIGGVEDVGQFRLRAHLDIARQKETKDGKWCCNFSCDETKEIISNAIESRKAFVEGSVEGGIKGLGSVKGSAKYKMEEGKESKHIFSLVKREQPVSQDDDECYSCRWDFVSGQTNRYYQDESGEIYVGGDYKLVKGNASLVGGVNWQSGITQQRTGYIIITGCCNNLSGEIDIEYAGVAATKLDPTVGLSSRTIQDIWENQQHQGKTLYRYLRMREFSGS